jgi:two-component system sensor histidine kinase PilS (NtrC family)
MQLQDAAVAPVADDAQGIPQRTLAVYGYYRVFLAAILLLLFVAAPGRTHLVGHYNPELYLQTSIAYFLASLASTLYVRLSTSGQRTLQGLALIAIDLVALTLLMHATGGPGSSITPLIVLTVAAGAILLPGRLGYLVAAVASLGILYEQFYFALENGLRFTAGSTQVGLLGVAIFGVAFVAQLLVRRVQETERLARERGREIVELEQINTSIIQRMRTGILVVDDHLRIRMANGAARHMLAARPWINDASLAAVSPELAARIRAWQEDAAQRAGAFRNYPAGPELDAKMTVIQLGDRPGTLLFLEDTTALGQQLQQMKLASLGRLTASIAHEIRNPLSAIHHAAQLLEESPGIGVSDRKLTHIVQTQAQRLNRIVENVLQLSRRQAPHSDTLELAGWLRQFRTDFLAVRDGGDRIEIRLLRPHVRVRIDPNHLQQILTNLCENGLRYGRRAAGHGEVVLEIDVAGADEYPVLRAFDNGPGVPPEREDSLFEPFFTTESSGTGLGLYIARELCEANRAQLAWIPAEDAAGKGCFQITFAHPGRIAS